MSKPVFSYCIHAIFDGREVVMPIPEVESFLIQRAIGNWRNLPLRQRFTEAGISAAIEAAFAEAHQVLRDASHRV